MLGLADPGGSFVGSADKEEVVVSSIVSSPFWRAAAIMVKIWADGLQ